MSAAVDTLRTHWDFRAREAQNDAERVDSTVRSQRARFADFARQLQGVRSIIDVGCGVGDLFGYLRDEGLSAIEYKGVDISEVMVRRAKEKYPTADFEVADVLEWPDEPRADAVVSIGIHSVPFDGVTSFMGRMLRKQFALSRVLAYASLLSAHYPHNLRTQCWWPDDIFSIGIRMTPWVAIHHDYLPHDFSITLYKEQFGPQQSENISNAIRATDHNSL